ncbi:MULTISPECIES: hypothetical protein [Sphingomonas]|uniref:hypothetical protein n=1 Tax=Sphingomonas TaxID=13687 RepID=UPI000DEFA97B|nr:MULTISPECIES: hypothetical protein [Sphingomonas]
MTKNQAPAVVEPRQKGFSADEYNAVAISSRLNAIRLLSSKFDVKAEALNLAGPEMQLSYGREVVACEFTPGEGEVAAIFRYNVAGKAGRKKVLSCVADFFVSYDVRTDAADAAAVGFCRNVGSFAAYPYFRNLMAQFAWGAGLELPPLPAIASTAHIEKKPKLAEGQRPAD